MLIDHEFEMKRRRMDGGKGKERRKGGSKQSKKKESRAGALILLWIKLYSPVRFDNIVSRQRFTEKTHFKI